MSKPLTERELGSFSRGTTVGGGGVAERQSIVATIDVRDERIRRLEWLVGEMKEQLFVSAIPIPPKILELHDPLAQINLQYHQKTATEVRALVPEDAPEVTK